jgi:hypothetical protein
MPSVALPFDTLSKVIVARAMFDGCLRIASVTHAPSSTLFVVAAIADSITQGSRTTAFFHCGTFVWSIYHIESYPVLSAKRHAVKIWSSVYPALATLRPF